MVLSTGLFAPHFSTVFSTAPLALFSNLFNAGPNKYVHRPCCPTLLSNFVFRVLFSCRVVAVAVDFHVRVVVRKAEVEANSNLRPMTIQTGFRHTSRKHFASTPEDIHNVTYSPKVICPEETSTRVEAFCVHSPKMGSVFGKMCLAFFGLSVMPAAQVVFCKTSS